MRSFGLAFILPVLLTACSMSEIAETNKKISDGASGLMSSLRGDGSDNSSKVMTPRQSEKKNPLQKVSSSLLMLIRQRPE